ncbi:PREDICTED: alpha-(1,3)-fucosyltransferase C-like [Eufriesea mexicana]|nr:PREDICTED: alpha-(1,3)-fucosyltransferase C-like [Eufriesea mexicana]XP_017758010.1 PREDICTED: alpha-(1,3)-fucosyltransferase C-like [Eufriesea mexicana]XP_017758011.1 PREDICTED: alpha-(1,3)-fucosyltransferase C-like [Eufriesea mexicana]XP_017758012.1 PREDICTED: alpha-(1,3)-fucosyltransferase C-like [Eufriesea mexicana]XP_017758013.1 PREDICTED: alpha-(1,3)-fucosyltransferase C-like [Eufriesea mexicana]XP_017758016.1 PREDICTED: alpha-(1,3)-fucosyltransferase C-like [Eufriesea mexicana]XP_01
MKLWTLGRTTLISVLILTFTLYILSFYFDCRIGDILYFRRNFMTDQRVMNVTRKILFWNTMFGDETFYMGKGDIFRDCPVNNCYATHDRSYVDLTEFDVVLFHANELEYFDLPKYRTSRQWYVFVNLESPANRPLVSPIYDDFFNITMTYRLDSDVLWTYATVADVHTGNIVAPLQNTTWDMVHRPPGDRPMTHEDSSLLKTISGKSRPIVWFVSNCQAKSGRQEYVNELSKHIPVDIYGKCGSKQCLSTKECYAQVVEPDYFFHLSFENSLCVDYVTEKLYNALRYNVVPIVYGGANYSLFAPPRSYIDALDFDTPRDLAEYLKKLMQNPRAYGEYFAWKRYYKIDNSVRHVSCNLCEFLHRQREPRMQNSLSDWYSRSKCPLQEFLRYHDYLQRSILKD